MQTAPDSVAPYTGQNQPQHIVVPRVTVFRQEREEGCWSMPPYLSIYPQGGTAFLPPPLAHTDLWSAQQTYPL